MNHSRETHRGPVETKKEGEEDKDSILSRRLVLGRMLTQKTELLTKTE